MNGNSCIQLDAAFNGASSDISLLSSNTYVGQTNDERYDRQCGYFNEFVNTGDVSTFVFPDSIATELISMTDILASIVCKSQFDPINQELLISTIISTYEINDRAEVENYLRENNDLLNFLKETSRTLLAEEAIMSIGLSIFTDIEEGWQKLNVEASTEVVDIDELLDLEDSLYINYFVPHISLLSARVTLALVR